jgi:hypothetical protein
VIYSRGPSIAEKISKLEYINGINPEDDLNVYLSKGLILYGKYQETNRDSSLRLISSILSIGSKLEKESIDRHIRNKVHPNFCCVEKENESSEISINQLRSVKEFMYHEPTLPSPRVVYIENAETLSKNAANSMLKALEEIPEDTCIILSTSRFMSILPTIRSRCYKFYVKKNCKNEAEDEYLDEPNPLTVSTNEFYKTISKSEELTEKFLSSARKIFKIEFYKNTDNSMYAENYIKLDAFLNLSRKSHADMGVAASLIHSFLRSTRLRN